MQIPKDNHIVDIDDDELILGYGKNKHTSADRFKTHILKNINAMIEGDVGEKMNTFFEAPATKEGGRRRRRKSRKKRKSKRKSRRKSKRKSKRKRKTKNVERDAKKNVNNYFNFSFKIIILYIICKTIK